jgi:hypothetical protein
VTGGLKRRAYGGDGAEAEREKKRRKLDPPRDEKDGKKRSMKKICLKGKEEKRRRAHEEGEGEGEGESEERRRLEALNKR